MRISIVHLRKNGKCCEIIKNYKIVINFQLFLIYTLNFMDKLGKIILLTKFCQSVFYIYSLAE